MVNTLVSHLVQFPIALGRPQVIILMMIIASNIALNLQHTRMIAIIKE